MFQPLMTRVCLSSPEVLRSKPLPSAANDHQRRNASLVAGAGAALLMEQADFAKGHLAATLVGLPLGITCHRVPRLRGAILQLLNLVQTIPSIALFGILMKRILIIIHR